MPINTANAKIEDLEAAETSELLQLYNKITGANVKKFADKKTAVRRTWKVIGQLGPDENVNDPKNKVFPKKESKRDSYENRTIQIINRENNRRIGTPSHKKYELLLKFEGKTLKEFKINEGKYSTLDSERGWPATVIRWCLAHGEIKLISK